VQQRLLGSNRLGFDENSVISATFLAIVDVKVISNETTSKISEFLTNDGCSLMMIFLELQCIFRGQERSEDITYFTIAKILDEDNAHYG
jgi:hypothetical protein